MLKAYNMKSINSGKPVVNQIIVENGEQVSFYSYGSHIITLDRDKRKIQLGRNYDSSTTTGRYRNRFLHDQGFWEIDTLPALRAQAQVGSVFINDDLYIIEQLND